MLALTLMALHVTILLCHYRVSLYNTMMKYKAIELKTALEVL